MIVLPAPESSVVDIKSPAHGCSKLEEFEQAVVGYLQVLECHTMAGGSDYLLKVVAKGIADYERFLRDHLLQRPHVQEAHSHIAMSEVKRTTELPLDLGRRASLPTQTKSRNHRPTLLIAGHYRCIGKSIGGHSVHDGLIN